MQRRHVVLGNNPPKPPSPHPPIISQSSLKTPHPWQPPLPFPTHTYPLIHTRNITKHDYVTKPVSLEKGEALWNSATPPPPRPSRSPPPVSPLFSQRGETGPWCSRSIRLSRGCTPPACWGTRFRRSRPRRRWCRPAWPHLRCCVKMSCCPASSTHCGRGRIPPHSGARGSRRSRQRQTVCLHREKDISNDKTWPICVSCSKTESPSFSYYLGRFCPHNMMFLYCLHTADAATCKTNMTPLFPPSYLIVGSPAWTATPAPLRATFMGAIRVQVLFSGL